MLLGDLVRIAFDKSCFLLCSGVSYTEWSAVASLKIIASRILHLRQLMRLRRATGHHINDNLQQLARHDVSAMAAFCCCMRIW